MGTAVRCLRGDRADEIPWNHPRSSSQGHIDMHLISLKLTLAALVLGVGAVAASGISGPATTDSDTHGLVDTSQGVWHLYEGDNEIATFTYGNPGDHPFMGDWDCDGFDSPGLYRRSNGFAYLRNANTTGNADVTFFLGDPGDIPLAGDFNGDGCDTLSIYRPSTASFYILNELGRDGEGLGPADFSFLFGDVGDTPYVGDFNGDGHDTVGLHRESTGLVYYRNSNSTGNADGQFFFGNPGDLFVAGDWTADGHDSPGIFRPSDVTFYERWSNTEGNADAWWRVGEASWVPVAGDFDVLAHPETLTITAAGDMGAGKAATATLNLIDDLSPSAHFVLGDFAYSELVPELAWCSYVRNIVGLSTPVQLISGNHEDDGPDGHIRNFTTCLPDMLDSVGDYGVQYYSDIGDLVRVVAISPNLTIDGVEYGYEPGTDERQWLEAVVADARSEGLWVVLTHHVVCISSAEKGCETGEELADWEAANVDLVLMGHAHNYQRSHQLACVDINMVSADCVIDTDNDHDQGRGAVFVIVGIGGRDRPVDRSDPEFGYFAALMGTGDPTWGHGAVQLDVSLERIVTTFVGSDTDYTDTFTVSRRPNQ